MITREQKEKLFAEYSKIFSNLSAGVLLDYKGISVNEMTSFRKNLADQQAAIKVLKNRVAKKAIKESKLADAVQHFTQPRALVYATTDIVSLCKVICRELEDLENCQIIGGFLIENEKVTFLNEKEVMAMSKLDSKEELLSKLLYILNAPLIHFARTISEVPASFVRVLSKIKK